MNKYTPTIKELAAEFVSSIDHALAGKGMTIDDFDMDLPHERARLIKTVYAKYPTVPIEIMALALDVSDLELLHAVRSIPSGLSFGMATELAEAFCKAEGVAKPYMLTEEASMRLYNMLKANSFCTETVRKVMVGCVVITRGQLFSVSPAMVHQVVLEEFGVTHAETAGLGRHPKVTLARHFTAYLCRRLTQASFPEIAMMMGKGSHSTFVEHCCLMEEAVKSEKKIVHFERMKNATYGDAVLYLEEKIMRRYGDENARKRTTQQSPTVQPAHQPGQGQSRHVRPEGQGDAEQPDGTVSGLEDRTVAA